MVYPLGFFYAKLDKKELEIRKDVYMNGKDSIDVSLSGLYGISQI